MKRFIAAFLLVGAIALAATYTKQNSRVFRVQMDVAYANGAASAVNVDAFLVSSFVNQADATDSVDSPTMSKVSFNLLDPALATTTITAGGKTVTYQQLAALIRQASLDRANAAGVQ